MSNTDLVLTSYITENVAIFKEVATNSIEITIDQDPNHILSFVMDKEQAQELLEKLDKWTKA